MFYRVLIFSVFLLQAWPSFVAAEASRVPDRSRLSGELFPTENVSAVIFETVQALYPDAIFSDGRLLSCGSSSLLEENYFPATPQVHFRDSHGAVLLTVFESDRPNAFALIGDEEQKLTAQIALSSALLETLSDRSELAFVIAHEMAHIRLDHTPLLPSIVLTPAQLGHVADVHKKWELEADAVAFRLLQDRNLNLEAPIRLLTRLETAERRQKSGGEPAEHPEPQQRISALSQLQLPSPNRNQQN